jgi:cytochrome c peroxidase
MTFRFVRLRRFGYAALIGLAAVLLSFSSLQRTPAERVQAYYSQHLGQLAAALTRFQQAAPKADTVALRAHFASCRAEYKRLEFAVEYYYPYAALRLNGAALPEADASQPNEPTTPAGFQVLEELVFAPEDGPPSPAAIRHELDNLLFQLRNLQQQPAPAFTETEVFDALRLNLYRLAAKGVSGFDSPVAVAALPEAVASLQGTQEVLALFPAADPALLAHLRRSVAALQAAGPSVAGFNQFNRAAFFTRYFNPLLTALHATQVAQQIPFVTTRRAVRPSATSFFAADAFDPYFFAPADAAPATPAVLALGAALFQEPALSGGAGRSCVSCHVPGQAYTDGLRVNSSLLAGTSIKRNTPTLFNAALQSAQFADGRVPFLEDQVHEVITNRAEMGGQLTEVTHALRKKGRYARQFAQAFPTEKTPLTERTTRLALAAYVRSLTSLNSRLDQFMRGDTTVLSGQEILGYNLFMGKAKCGTCHYQPLFNGTVPPLYDRVESEVLGVPATPDTLHASLDDDQGKYLLHHIPHQRYSFKTPSVRNAARTAPYMHNGVYQTLPEVLAFYEKGGGQGLGLILPNQTLAPDRLHLTAAEQQAIIAFIGALSNAEK